MEADCVESQGSKWTVVPEKKEEKIKKRKEIKK
jgi:hypothetical protein